MAERLLPLFHSHDADQLESELKDLFVKLYVASLAATDDDINVYGAPHLGSFSLIERSIDQDGLTVLRETTEDRIRYLFKAWRHRNPERGLHFLRLYLFAIFGDSSVLGQLWQNKALPYPTDLRTQQEVLDSGMTLSQFFLTSRVRVDVDTEVVPAKLLASLKSAVAARILLNVRVGRFLSSNVGVANATYGANIMRKNNTEDFGTPPQPDFFLVSEIGEYVVSEDGFSHFLTEEYPLVVPQSGGIIWQTLLDNVATRRRWDTLGVRRTLLQWVAVDGYSFIDNPWLPTYNVKLNLNEFVSNPWAQELIVGLPGFFNEYTARTNLAQLADWGQKFGTLNYPPNVTGFYFPVEIDPTWTTAKEDMAAVWPMLPRPLYVSAYYGQGIDGEVAAQWLADLLPPDVILMFQDGVGAFNFSLELARTRIKQLETHLGAHRVHVIAEAFIYNTMWDGTPGQYYIPLEPDEYKRRINSYADIHRARRLWVFDGPNYLSAAMLQRLNGVIPVATPTNLAATRNPQGDIRMTWDRTSTPLAKVSGYTVRIYDTSGNNVIRTISTSNANPEGFYSAAMGTADFGFPPTFLVYDVAERTGDWSSDFSRVFVGTVENGVWLQHSIGLVGGGYMANFFSDFTDTANPGTTGAEGGAFTVAAYALRQAVATEAGLDVAQVATFNMAVPGSYLTKIAADLVASNDYWWDTAGNTPGPALIATIARLEGSKLTSMVWGGSSDQNVVVQFPEQLEAITAAFTPAMLGVIRTIRDAVAFHAASFKLWVHPYLRAFFGDADPQEANSIVYATLRKVQVEVVRSNQPLYRIGTWGPGCDKATGYWNENGSWINPLPATAHAAAAEIGKAIARDTSLLNSPPSWAIMQVIYDGQARWLSGDIIVTWKPEVATKGMWLLRNLRADTLAEISVNALSTPTFTFTRQQQLDEYGFTANDIVVTVQELEAITDFVGPVTRIERSRDDSQIITDIGATRSSWGDLELTWDNSDDPDGTKNYRVNLFDPDSSSTTPMRTIEVGPQGFRDGKFYCDYPNALNVPDAVAAKGGQYHWQVLAISVECVEDAYISDTVNVIVELDNNAFVEKVALCGINSLVGGYFNDLSDPTNHGGTGIEGRRDLVAAQTFRHALAQALGLRDIQVMPVMVVVGSSPINPMPYQSGFDPNNYWWSPDNNAPGPNLTYADGIVQGLGRAPDYFIECGSGETTGISYAPVEQRQDIVDAFKSSNIAMLAWIRANWGNPDIEVWFQGATTSWYGTSIPPQEVNWEGAKLLRDAQTDMALNVPGFKVGSYVPDGNKYTTFYNEMATGVGWVHYTLEGYHAAAAEMGASMGTNTNLASTPPAWTTAELPTDVKAGKLPNGDIKLTWGTTAPLFVVQVYNPGDGALLRTATPSVNEYIYTKALQIADFGNEASYVQMSVGQIIDGEHGPLATFVGSTWGDFAAPTGLAASKMVNDDIQFKWNTRAGITHYYVVNYDITNSAVLSASIVEGNTFLFTRAQQVAAYGFDSLFTSYQVYECDADTGTVGPNASFNGDAARAQNPTGGVVTRTPGSDAVHMSWNALDGTSWRVRHYNVGDSTIFLDRIVNAPTDTLTEAEQIAEYGYTVGFVSWEVTAINANGAASQPVNFSGSP